MPGIKLTFLFDKKYIVWYYNGITINAKRTKETSVKGVFSFVAFSAKTNEICYKKIVVLGIFLFLSFFRLNPLN